MNDILGSNIMHLRKENGMTQEQLATALGISYQAVSKWETGNSSPDISTLPLLADLFSVSIDTLFGRPILQQEPVCLQEKEEFSGAALTLPWPDDDTLHMVLYCGHTLIGHDVENLQQEKQRFQFEYEGPALNVQSDISVSINGDVSGSVSAGTSVECGDIKGTVTAGAAVSCSDVGGTVNAGADVNCGDVAGDMIVGGNARCGDVNGVLRCNGSVSCGDVGRGVNAGGNVDCDDVGGNVSAGGSVTCEEVAGNVYAGTRVQCENVAGTVIAGGYAPKKKGTDTQVPEDDFDRALDDMIDRTVENSIQFGVNMSNFGEDLGQKISSAVQKAMDFGRRFGNKNVSSQDDTQEE